MSFLLFLLSCSSGEAPTQEGPKALVVETATVRVTELTTAMPVLAVLEAREWQSLYFQKSGSVARVWVEEGEKVKKGALLASLDTAAQENMVAQAELRVKAAELDLAQAQHDLDATRQMASAEAASPAKLHDDEQRVIEAENALEQARLSLEGQRIALRQMKIIAPFDGVLAEMNLRVGQQIKGEIDDPDNDSGKRPPVVLIDPSAYSLRASVAEGQAAALSLGLPARVNGLDRQDQPLEGAVFWIAPSVDRESRTVAFKVDVVIPPEGAPSWVRDGSSVLVELQAARRSDALSIPDDAVLYHGDEAYVYVIDNGKAVRTPIVQGLVAGGTVEVQTSLQAGQQVAIDQLHLLEDGLAVNVAQKGTP